MSILSKIRNNITLIVGVVFVSLIIFVLNDFFTGAQRFSSGPSSVGSVNGRDIDAKTFKTRYDIIQQNYQAQGVELSAAQNAQILDDAWNGLVAERVFDEEMASVGLKMTSEELGELFLGEEVSPIVTNYFTPPGGQFNRQLVAQYISKMEKLEDVADEGGKMTEQEAEDLGNYREIKQVIARARKREQYLNMVKAGYTSSNASAKYRYVQRNAKRSINFLGVSYAQIPDSTVKVSDADLREYINAHPKLFKQEEETYFTYVKIDVNPSHDDTLRAEEAVRNRLLAFATQKPDTANKEMYKSIVELPESVRDSVLRMSVGQVVGPKRDGATIKAFKLVDRKAGEETYAHVRIMKFMPAGPTKEDSTKALAAANEAKKGLTAGNFAEKAMALSQDFGTKQKGGDLGWVGVKGGVYGEAVDNAIKAGGAGSISAPVKGNGGYYLVYVIAKSSDKFAVEDIAETIFAGSKTKEEAFKKANMVAGQASSSGNLTAACKAANLVPMESGGLPNSAKQLPGLGEGREIILWGINDAKVGQISEVFSLEGSYVVAQVTKKRAEGVKEPADIRPQYEAVVRKELKAKIIRKKLESMGNSGDFNALAQKYGAGAFASTASDINFETASIPGIGMEPKVVGTVFGLKQGQISKPIEGANGVYLVQLTGISTPEVPAEAVLKTERDQDALQNQMQWQQKIERALIEIADVKDERHKAGF